MADFIPGDIIFRKPADCIRHREIAAMQSPMRWTGRPKERQTQCMACMRWCYDDGRCNLFTTARNASPQPEKSP